MENKKIASVFGEVWCLLVGIFGIVVAATGYINAVMSMIGSSQIPYLGGFGIVASIITILYETPILLIGIGGILLYSNGKKGILNTTGIGMIKVSVMIRGIIAFVLGVIVSIVLLIPTFAAFSLKGGVGVGFILLLIAAVCIFITVMFLIFTLGLNKVLKKTVEAYKSGKYECEKSVTFGGVVVIVYITFCLISTLISLVAKSMFSDIASNLLGGFADEMLGQLGLAGNQATSIISSILTLVSEIGMFVLVLMAIMFASKMKSMSVVKSSGMDFKAALEKDNQVASTVTPEPVVTPEPEQATVQLDVTPEPPVDIPSKVDVKVFEGKITSLSGMDKGATYTIKAGEEIIIGKDPNTANIIVDKKYEKISRRHCGIKYDAENDIYLVIDYSMNGTYINSVKQLSKNIYVKVPKGTIINLAKENIDYKLC